MKASEGNQLSPIELAQRQNQKLLSAYQARLSRAGTGRHNLASLVSRGFKCLVGLPAVRQKSVNFGIVQSKVGEF